MCGIAGSWEPRSSPEQSLALVQAMTEVLKTRGPDAHGHWGDGNSGLVLGHRRLSILDLSERASQPMLSPSGRYALTYNGEIYNFRELRKELEGEGIRFRGDSDTEVALAAIEAWGIERAVGEFVGMFALALWDRQERDLYLVRDRLGIKPLYYGQVPGGLCFASQLKAILEHKRFSRELSTEALAAYLKSSCVPSGLCIFRDAHKVEPGTILRFRGPNLDEVEHTLYWNPAEVAMAGQNNLLADSEEVLIDQLDELLTEAVRCRLVSDVPLGAFLSGGIDSSLIVSLMKKLGGKQVKTFTIGTEERSHDESGDARRIAEHLGTDHHELIVTPQLALDTVGTLARQYDEPFADSSQIPTLLVSTLARGQVTVSLSGDGGDELFGGYNRHTWGPRIAGWNRIMPRGLRLALAGAAGALKPQTWDAMFDTVVPKRFQIRLPSDKLNKIARCLRCESEEALYEELAASNADPEELLVSAIANYSRPKKGTPALPDAAHRFMYRDMVGYLASDILTKVDRASMAVSLESRVPLLDHRVVEFAWRLPRSMKIAHGETKWILRQVLYRYVPKLLLDRPKSGFGIPVGEWLRGPLREWAEELLGENRLRQQGVLQPEPIRRRWQEHLSRKRDWDQHLWDILMFQSWWDEYKITTS